MPVIVGTGVGDNDSAATAAVGALFLTTVRYPVLVPVTVTVIRLPR